MAYLDWNCFTYLFNTLALALGIKSRGNLWQIAINIPQTDHCCCGILILTDRTIYTTFSAWEMVCSWQIRSNQYVLRFLERNYTLFLFALLMLSSLTKPLLLPLPKNQINKVYLSFDDVPTSNFKTIWQKWIKWPLVLWMGLLSPTFNMF